MATASRYRSEGGISEANCCSESSSNSDGFASSKVEVRADMYSMLAAGSGVPQEEKVLLWGNESLLWYHEVLWMEMFMVLLKVVVEVSTHEAAVLPRLRVSGVVDSRTGGYPRLAGR